MQEEPFAWSMHENIKAAVNPFEHYGKKNASRFVVRIVEKINEYQMWLTVFPVVGAV